MGSAWTYHAPFCGGPAIARYVQIPALLCALSTQAIAAQDADTVGRAFADNCLNPYLTAQTAQETLTPSGARIDFYDLRPFSSAAPSPVTGAAATPGTDRRCEVAVDGDVTRSVIKWSATALKQEGLTKRVINVPTSYSLAPGAKIAKAVQLNPDRIAVLQIGTRPGPNGVETFMNVERLTPLSEAGL